MQAAKILKRIFQLLLFSFKAITMQLLKMEGMSRFGSIMLGISKRMSLLGENSAFMQAVLLMP